MPETGKLVDMTEEKKARKIEPVETNGPDRETFLYFLGQIMQIKDDIEAVTKPHKDKLKTIKRAAKDHGLFLGEIREVEKLLVKELDETPEEKVARRRQYEAWAGIIPKGAQIELPFTTKSTADDRLEDIGYQYGLIGKTLPHEEGTEAWQTAMVGWNKGQDVLKKRFVTGGSDVEG
jgi:hypothetical protein